MCFLFNVKFFHWKRSRRSENCIWIVYLQKLLKIVNSDKRQSHIWYIFSLCLVINWPKSNHYFSKSERWTWYFLEKIFKFLQIKYFRYFQIISPYKRAWSFIWTKLNSLNPRILCAKFGWNWSSGSGEEDETVQCLQTDGQ